VAADSGVSDQPKSDKETYEGAFNRALGASKAVPDADFWVGVEGGIETKGNDMESFAWIVVRSREGSIGKGKSGVFFLPPRVAALIREGKELGEADDIVFKQKDSKMANGAIGILTGDVITRSTFYSEATITALIPFKNPPLYL
jgi:inosine/xanthosine triphosphatase